MKSIIYDRNDIINLIKSNCAAYTNCNEKDLFVKFNGKSVEVVRRDGREIVLNIPMERQN